jgi:hypothetical protein
MDRLSFIKSTLAVVALQAIPASVLPADTSNILPEISYAECLQQVPLIRVHDVLISPDGEAYVVTMINESYDMGRLVRQNSVQARVIDGNDVIELSQEQAQAMCCHDWDDLEQ